MPKIHPFSLLALLAVAAVGFAQKSPPPPPAAPAWQEFKSAEGNFAVLLPGRPTEVSQTSQTEIGKVPIRFFTATSGPVEYVVMYADYPIVFNTPGAIKASLDGGREMLLNSNQGTLLSETQIAYGRFPGREWKVSTPGGPIWTRSYLVHQRLYSLIVGLQGNADTKPPDPKAVGRFFDSFKLIAEPVAPAGNVASVPNAPADAGKSGPPPEFFNRPTEWREFGVPAHGLKVHLPSEPYHKSTPLAQNDARLLIETWLAKGDDLLCLLAVQSLIEAPREEGRLKILFNGFLSGVADSMEAKIVSEAPSNFRGYPGREFKLQSKLGSATGSAYVIGNKIYALLALSLGERAKPQDIARFFDSFDVTAALPPASAPPPPPPPFQGQAGIPGQVIDGKPPSLIRISGGVLQASAVKKVEPKIDWSHVHVRGTVQVLLIISEEGKVISAEVISGHAMLRDACLEAARQWEFRPIELSGVRVKAQGVLTFNFTN